MFNTEQKYRLLSGMGYSGPMAEEAMEQFISASPEVTAKMGKFSSAAKKIMGTPNLKLADGGLVTDPNKPNTPFVTPTAFEGVQQQVNQGGVASVTPTVQDVTQTAAPIQVPDAAQIAEGTGQAATPTPEVAAPAPVEAKTTETPETAEAAQMGVTLVGDQTEAVLQGMEAAVAQPTPDATVRGQMSKLMAEFDEGTPPWAAPAMRTAMGQMAARGLGASSMAGSAIVQAAMESALPIASQDAKTVAAFEMKNLDNKQQTMIFKTQQRLSSLLSDQSFENAAAQFNAQSENQVNMFRTQMESSANQFNTAQINAVSQFNAGRDDAIKTFNAEMQEQRAQFNAKNDVLIQQANVSARNQMFALQVQTEGEERAQELAIQAEAKQRDAVMLHESTQSQLAREFQAEQDAIAHSISIQESSKDRALSLITATMNAETQKQIQQMAIDDNNKTGVGELLGWVLGGF